MVEDEQQSASLQNRSGRKYDPGELMKRHPSIAEAQFMQAPTHSIY